MAQRPGRSGSSRPTAKAKNREARKGSSSSAALKAKEEEYMRLNAELEAKTAALVQEAEDLVKGNFSMLSELDPSVEQQPQQREGRPVSGPVRPRVSEVTGGTTSSPLRVNSAPRLAPSPQVVSSKPVASGHKSHHACPAGHAHPAGGRVADRASHGGSLHGTQHSVTHGHSQTSTPIPGPHGIVPTTEAGPGMGQTATPPYKTVPTGVDETVRLLQRQLESEDGSLGRAESVVGRTGVIPESAEEMGSEAFVRFLKAKLRVLQEELDRVCQEVAEKDKAMATSAARLKQLTDENAKLQRSYQTLQTQMSKYRESAGSLKHKCEGLEAQLLAMRKEVEATKASGKKAASHQGAMEVRLNRALEEAEDCRTHLQKERAENKDSRKQERQRFEQLQTLNKQLERQRNELMTAFKKQVKLIDILKRQKMHIEAAKLLSFSEEEFVKALDWGSS